MFSSTPGDTGMTHVSQFAHDQLLFYPQFTSAGLKLYKHTRQRENKHPEKRSNKKTNKKKHSEMILDVEKERKQDF